LLVEEAVVPLSEALAVTVVVEALVDSVSYLQLLHQQLEVTL
jgi:hypothetical protein